MDEIHLVKMMKTGDRHAFDLLYQKYENPAIRTAWLITGNKQDSEDIVQETFVKMYQNIQKLENEEGFKAWFYQILTRTAWRYGKKKAREIPDEEIEQKADRADKTNIADQYIREEDAGAISRAVRMLPKKQAAVIVLFYYNSMSCKEIARVLGCREGTVKSRMFAARNKLKVLLQDYGKEAYSHEQSAQRAGTVH